jgi:hypothetical protein
VATCGHNDSVLENVRHHPGPGVSCKKSKILAVRWPDFILQKPQVTESAAVTVESECRFDIPPSTQDISVCLNN